MNIKTEKNILTLNNKKITFKHNIRQVNAENDNIIVLLGIPNNDQTLDNIYCYGQNGIIKWQVQSIKEAFPEMKNVFPFEQMAVIDGKLSASDFYGRRFFINIDDGQIIGKDIVK